MRKQRVAAGRQAQVLSAAQRWLRSYAQLSSVWRGSWKDTAASVANELQLPPVAGSSKRKTNWRKRCCSSCSSVADSEIHFSRTLVTGRQYFSFRCGWGCHYFSNRHLHVDKKIINRRSKQDGGLNYDNDNHKNNSDKLPAWWQKPGIPRILCEGRDATFLLTAADHQWSTFHGQRSHTIPNFCHFIFLNAPSSFFFLLICGGK